jgi:XTP/dITP diphosphohydrolase
LSPFNFEIVPQSEYGVPDVPETGLTFIENALIKARHASQFTGLPAISDDSGLLVSALNDAPGLYSARFAGEHCDHDANINKLLQLLQNTEDRRARFYCVLVFISHAKDPTPLIGEGVWYGEILRARRGENGFGYDPIFFDNNENRSAAELDSVTKNQISHRGRALQCLLEKLQNKLG